MDIRIFHRALDTVEVNVNSVNRRGFGDVKCLLESLGYHPGLYRRYKDREVWGIVIHRKDEVIRFPEDIGFSIARKQNKLLAMIERKRR